MAKTTTALQASELSWHQARFVEYYIQNGNASASYLKAYGPCSYPGRCASSLMQLPIVIAAIHARQEQLKVDLDFTTKERLEILVGIARATVDDFTEVMRDPNNRKSYTNLGYRRFAIESLEGGQWGTKLKLADRKWAISELSRILALDKGNNSTGQDIDHQRVAERVEAIKDRRKA